MSRERILFFDLDDTLYRRSAPFGQACRKFFGTVPGADWTERAFAATQRRCEEVYVPTRRGEMTVEDGFVYRFQKGFADVDVSLTKEEALSFRDAYQEAQKHLSLEPVMEKVLPECRENFAALGVITNGRGSHQRAKMETMELFRWIDPSLVVISGEIGIDKPAEGIFRYAEQLAAKSREDLIYVGDSMENDVQAAENAGWQAVLWDWTDTDASVRELLQRA